MTFDPFGDFESQGYLRNLAKEKDPDRVLYDNFAAVDSPLLKGLELTRFLKPHPNGTPYGIDKTRFGQHPDNKTVEAASLVVPDRAGGEPIE